MNTHGFINKPIAAFSGYHGTSPCTNQSQSLRYRATHKAVSLSHFPTQSIPVYTPGCIPIFPDMAIAKYKDFVAEFITSNEQLAHEIIAINISHDGSREQKAEAHALLKGLVSRLWESIRSIEQHRTPPAIPNTVVIEGWRSILTPIRALTTIRLPGIDGYFVAARMLLYLAVSLCHTTRLRRRVFLDKNRGPAVVIELCMLYVELDELLLATLRPLWQHGCNREAFFWMFMDYSTARGQESHDEASADEAMALQSRVQALTTTELDAAKPRIMDSPLDLKWHYIIVPEDGEEPWRFRPLLRRSRQFVYDARRISKENLIADALSSRVPPELQRNVSEFLGPEVIHPYISMFDFEKAYEPFPDTPTTECQVCLSLKSSKKAKDTCQKQTCPVKSTITIWNLALRTFHTFHRTDANSNSWGLCNVASLCPGHHSDKKWHVSSESELADVLEEVVRLRCGESFTLAKAGMGAWDILVLGDERSDTERRETNFGAPMQFAEGKDEREIAGGIGGLLDAMLHGRTLLGKWDSPSAGGGSSSSDPSWLFGRTVGDERRAKDALQGLHAYCDLC